VKLTNKDKVAIKPDFTITLIDKNGMETGFSLFSWMFTSIEPGETRFDEQTFYTKAGPPFYYTAVFKDPVRSVDTASSPREAKKDVEQDNNSVELRRLEETFKKMGISPARREEIFHALCSAELRAQKE
jgi:hypothetical protein